MKSVTAFAPATVANVSVGFDLLGFPIEGVGDLVRIEKISDPKVIIQSISGISNTAALISTAPEHNTAGLPLITLIKDLRLDFGFSISIQKGIPLSSGMGGSAASAVAAVVAANELLPRRLDATELIHYALKGEALASGSYHADNVTPCLVGGLVYSKIDESLTVLHRKIPTPKELYCILIHPHEKLDTKAARAVLKPQISLAMHVQQSANLAGLLIGCFENDLNLIGHSLRDLIIEPQRSSLIRGFDQVKLAALSQGALGCSISGAGPSVFAWSSDLETAKEIEHSMVRAFVDSGCAGVDSWISPISQQGARIAP